MAGSRDFGVRLRTLKSVKHYLVLGCYLAAVSFIVMIVRASGDLPRALREETWNFSSLAWWMDLGNALFWVAVVFGGLLLLGAGIGWIFYVDGQRALRLEAKKRAHAGEESFVVRR